ncbi:MAG: class I SAM-dependent methyltransferase [Pseudomonadota bacterium]
MTDLEDRVSAHYTTEDLIGRIKAALAAAGADPDAPTPADLKPVDEFHTGGLAATEALLEQVSITPETRVLDIGCGLGGTARYIADRHGAAVTAFDLTPLYIDAAKELTALVGLEATYHVGSALEMPVADGSADVATMFHVGMNIEDKAGLMSEAARVLAPGGVFALFDVMQMGEGELTFPFPWAEEAAFSFVEVPERYREAAAAAGLEPVAERERKAFTLDFFETAFAAVAEHGGPPPFGIHLLMRETAGQKIQNYVTCVKAGLLAPVEMIFRKPV